MLTGYNYIRKITLDHTKFPSTLTDFPLLVKLTEANFDFSKILTSGGLDIRFTESDGETLLKFDREFHGQSVTPAIYGSDVCTGGTPTASSTNGAEVASRAFDNTIAEGSFWTSSTSASMPQWLKYDLGSSITKTVQRYGLAVRMTYSDGIPSAWTFQGSNDDSNWTTLDTQSGQTWANNNLRYYSFSNSTAYRYYRLNFTTSSHVYVHIMEVEMLEITTPEELTDYGYYWVKIPSVSSSVDTEIYMFYGKSGDSDGTDASNTWDSYHKAVYHLKETGNGTANEYLDSKNGYNGRGGNGTAAYVPTPADLIYKGQLFDGSNDFIQIADQANLELGASDFTISFKVKFTSTSGNHCWIGRATSVSSHFYFDLEGGNIKFRDYNGGDIINFSTSWTPTIGQIYDIEVTRNGSTWTIYVDAVQKVQTTSSATILNRSEGWQIGGNTAISHYANGVIDEVRFSIGLDRGSSWRTARINSDNDDVNIVGSEQTSNTLSINDTDTVTLSDTWELTTNPNPLDISESLSLSESWNIEDSPKFEILNESITLSENWSFLKAFKKLINTDLHWKKLYTNVIKTMFDWIIAKSINTSLTWLGIRSKTINTDLRWLSIGYNDVPPIAPSDIQILINSIDMVVANDVDIQTGNIVHTIGQKSQASFTLARRHDDLDRTHAGVASQITNQNPIQIYIKGNLEFDGFISNLSVDSETETVQVMCLMSEPAQNRSTIDLPMPSVNEKLHLYHCLINKVTIDNPKEDINDPNPQYFKGVKVDLGKLIQQQADSYRDIEDTIDGKGRIATSVEDGSFIAKPNYSYFWAVLVKNIRTGLQNGDYRYIGTSLASTTTDLWAIMGASPTRQKIKDNLETELGYYYVGAAPYKEISCKNGELRIVGKYQDRNDGLYHVYDEYYNYVDFAKIIAGLEYEKILNINGDPLPITSSSIDVTFDAYYYYTIKLLTRINVTNSTVLNTYKNSNGFPTSVKSISISFATMKITLSTDNRLSQDELDEIDARKPDEESPLYLTSEQAVLVYRKFDLKTWQYVS